jgi:hypothetical protein
MRYKLILDVEVAGDDVVLICRNYCCQGC